jgi:predicted transglutaminase-like cysteine proteinase
MRLFTLKTLSKAAFALAILYSSYGYTKSATLEHGRVSSTPFGWVDFCKRNASDCTFRSDREKIIKLIEKEWDKIVRINDKVNREITAVTDLDYFGQAEYWTYPVNNKGDCEDFALQKRKLLAQAGLPMEALLITIVKDSNNEGHAVLTVRTDYGDFILDNQEDLVKLWHNTGYKFLKRMSPTNPNDWLLLNPGAVDSVAASR